MRRRRLDAHAVTASGENTVLIFADIGELQREPRACNGQSDSREQRRHIDHHAMAIIVSVVFRFVLGKPVDRGRRCPAGRPSWSPLPGIGVRFAWPERQDLMILTGLA